MSDTAKIRVGMISARELELDVDDPDTLSTEVEAAVGKGDAMVWITDARGHRYGIVAAKLAFIQVEKAEMRPGVGFAAPGET
jgi:hypothetical protein